VIDLGSEQLCVQFYRKYPIDLIIYSATLISTNVVTLIISLAFCFSIYGWLTVPMDMRESIIDIYKEMKITTQVVFIELWTTGQGAIKSVWESLSVIKTIQFAFLLLLLISVPDVIDYFKKALIRFAKLS